MSAGQLADVLDRRVMEERQAAVRALLRYPLLTSAGPDADAFKLVRRHAAWLRDWFRSDAGWFLLVDTSIARLRKRVADTTDATRPALTSRSRSPFSRSRYALLCLVLGVLDRADAQVTLGYVAERTVALAADPALQNTGFRFSLEAREQRADLVVVVRLLQQLGVVARVAGDEQDFVNSTGSRDALYDIERRALAGLLVSPRGASMVGASTFDDRLKALTQEIVPDTADARTRSLRHALVRRLLDNPVVYGDDLSAEEQAYFASQRPFLLKRVCDATGWRAEARAEGVALLDPTGDATDLRMPEEGTDGHATLLVAEFLAGRIKARGATPVTLFVLQKQMRDWMREHRSHWRKGSAEPGAEVLLCDTALRRLEGLGLIHMTPEGIVPRPAIARFEYQPAVLQADLEPDA